MKNSEILLSVIVVNYLSERYLQECLRSIGKDFWTETIIINNNKINRGYGAGCNFGAKKATGKYLLFLNPDTIILNTSLKKMINFMEKNPKIDCVGPKTYFSPKKERQLSFCRFTDPLMAIFVFSPLKNIFQNNFFWRKYIYADQLNSKTPIEVETLSGAAIMVRRKLFEELGGFDERFFLYFEENDLCRRIKKKGGKIIFLPEAEIIHFGGKSTFDRKAADKIFKTSRFLFFRKHYFFILAYATEGIIRTLEFLALLTTTLLKPSKKAS